jgi:hypothetical protein
MGSVGYLYDTKDAEDDEEKLSALTASFKVGLDFGKNFQINAGPRMFMFPTGNVTSFSLGIRFAGF